MSGGSYQYAFGTVADCATEIRRRSGNDVLRLAFASHLELVAKAMHDIEWVDSGDTEHGSEYPAIEACFRGDGMVLAEVERQLAELGRVVADVKAAREGGK